MTDGSTIKTTEYLDGFQYENQLLQFFPHSEGYVRVTTKSINPNNPVYDFNYAYNYTDHLGNIRLTYAKDPQTGNLKVMEENHYYPFGLKHQNYGSAGMSLDFQQQLDEWGVIIAPTTNNPFKYKFGNKELQEELGLNMYDFGARNYDPAIGRWINMDALAEKFISWNPYNYTLNNPIIFIDPTGMAATYNWDNGKYYDNGREVTFEEAMNSYGLNTDGSQQDKEEPPIDLFGSTEKENSIFHQVAKNWKYTVGDGNFYVFAHANSKGIQYQDKDGVIRLAQTAEEVNMVLSENSPEWKKAMAEGKSITLTIYACNTASKEYITHDGRTIKREQTIADEISSSSIFSNVKVIAADGYVMYGKKNGNPTIKGVQNHKNNGGFITIQNGERVYKKQRTYISPSVTKELPKKKIKCD